MLRILVAVIAVSVWGLACGAPGSGGVPQAPRTAPSIEGRVQSTILTREVPSASSGDPNGVVSATVGPDVPVVTDDRVCASGGCSVMVVSTAGGGTGLDRASVHIPPGATLLVMEGGETRAGRHDDVRTGSTVRVWFEGPVAESYPVQATAGTVLVIRDGGAASGQADGGRAASHGGPVRDHVSLVDNLRAKGMTVMPVQSVKQPFLSVEGTTLSLSGQGITGTASVQSYDYPNARAAQADASAVGPDGSTMRTMVVDWAGPPHFFLKERVLVLYVGSDPTVIRVLTELLGPQFAGR